MRSAHEDMLDAVTRGLEGAADRLEQARAWQATMIRAAHEAGMSNRAIARASGLSHETVRRVLASEAVGA